MADTYTSFEAFWPFYLSQHSHPTNRSLHLVGTSLSWAAAIVLIVQGLGMFAPLCLIPAYGAAWVGHFIIEKNRPATFTYPVWSFRGDHRMLWLFVTGRLDGELVRQGIVRG